MMMIYKKKLFGQVKVMEMSVFQICNYLVENNYKFDDIECFKQKLNKLVLENIYFILLDTKNLSCPIKK